MASPVPNHQKLIVPSKNFHPSKQNYGRDMRAIEQWANEGIVRSLHAGSGITLNPADGIDMGQGIEISAAGGGGASIGFWGLAGGGDGLMQTGSYFGGFFNGNTPNTYPNYNLTPLVAPPGGGTVFSGTQSFGMGWFATASGGSTNISACLLPQIQAPTFTGGPMQMGLLIVWAASIDGNDAAHATITVPLTTITSGFNIQFVDTDFTPSIDAGSDLTWTAGSGINGNGWVSASGKPYLGGYYGDVIFSTVTAFT